MKHAAAAVHQKKESWLKKMLKHKPLSLMMLAVYMTVMGAYVAGAEKVSTSVVVMDTGDNDPCDRRDVDPTIDGCSVPFGLPFFFKELFTPSCNRHDICYRCVSRN